MNSKIAEAIKEVKRMECDAYHLCTTKVGCVLLDENYGIISRGSNRPIFEDEKFLQKFARDRDEFRNFICHAELIAFSLVSWEDLKNIKKCVVSLLPCTHCFHLLAVAGVREIYFNTLLARDLSTFELVNKVGIHLFQWTTDGNEFNIIRASL